MTRRQVVVGGLAGVALAGCNGGGHRPTGPDPAKPPGLASVRHDESMARRFLNPAKEARIVPTPALWMNFYGLIAAEWQSDGVRLLMPKADHHELKLWYFDARGNVTSIPVQSTLAINGMAPGKPATASQHPWDDLKWALHASKLFANPIVDPNASPRCVCRLTGGVIFGGRPYQGDTLLYWTDQFQTLADAENAPLKSPPAGASIYSATDNFNWITTGNASVVVDGRTLTLPVTNGLAQACLTHSQLHGSQHAVVVDCHHYQSLFGPAGAPYSLPAVAHGQGGAQALDFGPLSGSDPICPTMVIGP